jgi:hypothetical protein
MEFPHRETAGECEHRTHAGELITELTLLVEQPGDQLAADLACRDLAAVLDVCGDPALAADGDELIVQVVTPRRGAAAVEQRMPLAS